MLKIMSIALSFCGALMLLFALLSGGAALMASIERYQQGHGQLFPDVEFYGLLALICCVLGIFSLIVSRRIVRILNQHKE
jgi:hypothetical protein